MGRWNRQSVVHALMPTPGQACSNGRRLGSYSNLLFLNEAHLGFGGPVLSSVHGDPFQSAQGAMWCWGWRSVFPQVKPASSELTPWPPQLILGPDLILLPSAQPNYLPDPGAIS